MRWCVKTSNSNHSENKTSKYDYIPDVSPIMDRAGIKMSLLDILGDKSFNLSAEKNSLDTLFYYADDINGKHG